MDRELAVLCSWPVTFLTAYMIDWKCYTATRDLLTSFALLAFILRRALLASQDQE